MTESSMSTANLASRLEAHPGLRRQIEALILAVEDEVGEINTADAIEMRVIEIMRDVEQLSSTYRSNTGAPT